MNTNIKLSAINQSYIQKASLGTDKKENKEVELKKPKSSKLTLALLGLAAIGTALTVLKTNKITFNSKLLEKTQSISNQNINLEKMKQIENLKEDLVKKNEQYQNLGSKKLIEKYRLLAEIYDNRLKLDDIELDSQKLSSEERLKLEKNLNNAIQTHEQLKTRLIKKQSNQQISTSYKHNPKIKEKNSKAHCSKSANAIDIKNASIETLPSKNLDSVA